MSNALSCIRLFGPGLIILGQFFAFSIGMSSVTLHLSGAKLYRRPTFMRQYENTFQAGGTVDKHWLGLLNQVSFVRDTDAESVC